MRAAIAQPIGRLRARSLAFIEADAALSDHWNLVAEAMNAIYAFTHDHEHGSDNELTLQYLGIRLFNAAGDFFPTGHLLPQGLTLHSSFATFAAIRCCSMSF
jgi:hypothetical protein